MRDQRTETHVPPRNRKRVIDELVQEVVARPKETDAGNRETRRDISILFCKQCSRILHASLSRYFLSRDDDGVSNVTKTLERRPDSFFIDSFGGYCAGHTTSEVVARQELLQNSGKRGAG